MGKTPFLGTIPVCSNIEVGSDNDRKKVDVTLSAGVVTEFDYVEPAKEIVLPDSSNGNVVADKLQVGESIPANVEQPKSGVRTGLRIASGVVSALGFGAALYGIIKMKNLANEAPDNKKDYEARLDDIDNHEWFRRFGLLFGGIGLVGFGLTFVF